MSVVCELNNNKPCSYCAYSCGIKHCGIATGNLKDTMVENLTKCPKLTKRKGKRNG